MKHILITMFVLALGLLSSGCSTISLMKPGGGRTIKVEGASYSRLWKVSNKVLAQQLTIVSSDEANGIIKAERPAGLATWGEVVGVFINPAHENAPSYTIEVVSKKRLKTQITGQNWEETVMAGIKGEL